MATPVVEATNVSDSAFGTSHTVDLPASIAAGDLLLVFFDQKETANDITFPAGWTEFFEHEIFAQNGLAGAWRAADGGEGASITVTLQFSQNANHNSYRISGAADPTSQPPEVATVSSGNPPNLTPTGGAKDYLWITVLGKSGTDNGTPPTNYGNEISSRVSGAGCESARRALNAASENPGAWGTPGANAITATIAVHPAADPTVTLGGNITDDDEVDIRAGGSLLTLTLLDDTWVAAGATFDAQRQGIIDGLDSAQSESTGWDALILSALDVTDVVRTSSTVVTITMPAVPTYSISANEVITATVPATALVTSADALIATPVLGIDFLVESVATTGTVTDDDELQIRNGDSTIILTVTNDTWVAAGATFEAQRQGIIDGLDSGGAEGDGWDAVVKVGLDVTDVVRTSDTVVTITLPAFPGYNITGNETITPTVPASALVASVLALVGDTFDVTFLTETAALSGTLFFDDEADVRAGGATLILTLTNAQWDADVGADNAQTQALIDGLDSDQAETGGWDAVVKAGLTFSDVARTSDTVVTITLPVFASYDITVNETITATLPASALEFPDALVATPTFPITVFPVSAAVVAASAGSTDTSSPHTVTLPSGVAAGNLLIIVFGEAEDDSATLAGWTKLAEVAVESDPNGRITFAVFYRRADGTEGASVDITTTFGANSAHLALRITGDDGGNPPEISSIPLAVTNTPNPASLTPTGGAKHYLWIALVGHQKTLSSSPTDYGDLLTVAGVGVDIGAIRRNRNIATEDPGTPNPPGDDLFTLSDPGDPDITAAATLAVYPAPAATPVMGPVQMQQREILLP